MSEPKKIHGFEYLAQSIHDNLEAAMRDRAREFLERKNFYMYGDPSDPYLAVPTAMPTGTLVIDDGVKHERSRIQTRRTYSPR